MADFFIISEFCADEGIIPLYMSVNKDHDRFRRIWDK